MIALVSLGYLALCAYLAMRSLAWSGVDRIGDGMAKLLVFTTAFFTVFFLGFHLPGYISVATGYRAVTVTNAACTLLIVATACLLAARRVRPPLPVVRREIDHGAATPAGFVPSATAFSFGAVALMLMFGFPQGYEVLAYHLPGAVQMLQSESLRAWDANFPHTFPANASIFYAFFLGFLPEKLVSATNLVFLAPLILGVFATSRCLGADRRAAWLVTCGLLSVPMIAFSAVELGADVGGIAFIAASMYFALTRIPSADASAVLAGLCAGLALGFKSLHLLSIGFIAIVILIGVPGQRSGWRAGLIAGVRRSLIFSAAVALTAGFWLIRNYADFGNPLHPVSLPLIGDLLGWSRAYDVDFSQRHATQYEWVRNSSEWLVYPWREWHDLGQNFKHSSGLGAFIAASVPVTLFAVSAAILRQGAARYPKQLILMLAVGFIIASWWVLDDHQPRYVLAALPYSMPLVAWVVTQADHEWRRSLDTLLGLCITAMLMVFVSKQALLFGDRIVLSGYTTRSLFYEYPKEIDRLPAGATILNLADRSWHYPLAGAGLTNRIVSMPEGRRILGLPPSLTAPQRVAVQAAPLKVLGITHVFVAGAVLDPDPCLRLDEVASWARNPRNGAPVKPRRLLAVTYLGSAAGPCRLTSKIDRAP